ncbi:carboxypeptidase-like regulatory domain-containing protein [Chitinophaga caseinilytica]|uniref:carboxypeptidase-like regulatory domain-containing protein n=1 Tax=Chitinophaga caseinilytica TaxID=2267521 RepID=UPI003C2CADDC
MNGWKRTIASIITLISFLPLHAQHKVKGIVKDAHTQELIPFATLQFVGTNTGMVTDAEGAFVFELPSIPSDSLLVRVMGYARTVLFVDRNCPNKRSFSRFPAATFPSNLRSQSQRQTSPSSCSGTSSAANRSNNYDRLDSYKYEIYKQTELRHQEPQHVKLCENRFTKTVFVHPEEYRQHHGKPTVPARVPHRKHLRLLFPAQPKKTKEIIKASRTSGLDNESVTKFSAACTRTSMCTTTSSGVRQKLREPYQQQRHAFL